MFEDFYDDFEQTKADKNFYVDSVQEFEFLISMLPLEEVGISFCGEVEVGQGISIITDKQINLNNPRKAIDTYQKVVEVRELTEAERLHVSKFKVAFNKIFEVFFRNEKWRMYLSILWTVMFGFDIAVENYLGALMMAACLTIYNSPVKYARELKKIFGNQERKEELKDELAKAGVLGYAISTPEDEGVQLYFRPKANQN